jgi:DNA polymerase elongation subunit (family B)
MLDQLKIGNILFLDIETVPAYPAYEDMPETFRILWEKKASYLKKADETPAGLYGKAAIFAEFGKIICISTGMIGLQEGNRILRLKSFFADNEHQLLAEFADMVTRLNQKREIVLCAHNGKEFDFPFISRRMLIQGIMLPPLFDMAGKRPWEIPHIDTLELWKFGDHKHYTSLELLAAVFQMENPKGDMDGSQVHHVYWKDKDMSRIVEYCRQDVITIAQLMLRFKGEAIVQPGNIIVLDADKKT